MIFGTFSVYGPFLGARLKAA